MQTINKVVLYCRPGFEKECAAEIIDRATAIAIYGFVHVSKQSGYVVFTCYQPEDAATLIKMIPLSSLIFARQFFATGDRLVDLPVKDRITPILHALDSQQFYGDLRVETAESHGGNALIAFCRKFTVPLRNALRRNNLLATTENRNKRVLHLFFISSDSCYVGYSCGKNNSPFYMGIPRLKCPSHAPSRSTLKLEEAFHLFIPYEEWQERLAPGMYAVDLGAAPGGWTYQLVKRGMMVYAIDNGVMDDALMATGQVKHSRIDGFKFVPKKANIDWLVCDMVEKPSRITMLVANWLINGWCREAIFNLKLPMKKRYEEVKLNLRYLNQMLCKNSVNARIQAKQLYHDREEITVHVQCIWRSCLVKKSSLNKENKST